MSNPKNRRPLRKGKGARPLLTLHPAKDFLKKMDQIHPDLDLDLNFDLNLEEQQNLDVLWEEEGVKEVKAQSSETMKATSALNPQENKTDAPKQEMTQNEEELKKQQEEPLLQEELHIDPGLKKRIIKERRNDVQRAIIYTDDIRDHAVTGEKLAQKTIDASKLKDGSVGTNVLRDYAVDNSKLADQSVI